MQKLFKFIRRPRVFIPAGVLLIVAGVVAFSVLSGEEETLETVPAKRGTVREEVAVVGRIQATQRLDLGLLGSGKISYVFGEEGDRVERGDLLVSLVSDDLQAQLASAQANLDREQIRLSQMVSGEEDAVSQANYDSASSAEQSAARALESQLRESYAATDSALGAYVDQFFEDPRSGQASFETYVVVGGTRYFIGAPQGDRTTIQRGHNKAVALLAAWREALGGTDLEAKVAAGGAAVAHAQLYLGDLAGAINRYRPTASTDQAVYDGFRADVAAARSAVNAAASGLSAAESSYRSAQSGKNVAGSTLALEQSAAEIAIQEAAVRSAEAQVALAQAQVSKNSIVSPVDGIVVELDAEVGEIASPGSAIVSVMADAPLEIEALVPEADVAKVEVDDVARVTMDAYPGVTFNARVIYVAYAETMVEGVATYKVRLQMEGEDSRLKPGMTTDLDIATNVRENVITVPQRAVITRSSERVVRVADGEVSREVKVETGIRGTDGQIEIVSGLSEGDLVIVGSKQE